MSIGFSDGTQAENWPQYYTGTQIASTGGAETDLPTGRAVKPPSSPMPEGIRTRGTPAEQDDPDYKDWLRQQEHERLQPPAKPDEDTPMSIDQTHHVPLIASALTKDGKNMYGLAVDHRVPLEMDFEGSKHNIKPFLIAHEAAELPVIHDLVKGGMDAKDAYNEAHDKVANPTEAAVRYAYAAKAGLDPDKFNEAYYAHIQKATDLASQPSDRNVHPFAHTTQYKLDPKSGEFKTTVDSIQEKLKGLSNDELSKALEEADKQNNEDASIIIRDEMIRRDTGHYLEDQPSRGQEGPPTSSLAGKKYAENLHGPITMDVLGDQLAHAHMVKGPMITPKPTNENLPEGDARRMTHEEFHQWHKDWLNKNKDLFNRRKEDLEFKNMDPAHEYEGKMTPDEEKYMDALSKQIQNRLTKFRTIKGDKE